jgi:hypothetical protein
MTQTIRVALLSLSATVAFAQSTTGIFPFLPPSVSTVPPNGDVNPYGVAFAPKNLPAGPGLQAGDILVSNFNDVNNLQGRGTSIVRIDKAGNMSTFFMSPNSRIGLSAAIGILSDGLVFIGNLPTADGTAATAQPGTLQVVSRTGVLLGTFGTQATVDGPWGMAIKDSGNGVTGTATLFLSNVLAGTVSRFNLSYNAGEVTASVFILASGFNHRPDPAALELGPSGLAYSASNDTLYVASSADNAVYQIAQASTVTGQTSATLLFADAAHLHGPLDISILPNGHLVIANSDGSNVDPNQPSELVEYTATGTFVGQMSVDPNNGGAFGVAINNLAWGAFRLAAVDDNANALKIWTSVIQ